MKAAALLYGPEQHHLDHLAPLASLLQIPLIVTEHAIQSLAQLFYPEVRVLLWNYHSLPEQIVTHYDTIFSCLPHPTLEEILFVAHALLGKRSRYIWCPHGNSDKGHHSVFMEGLQQEQTTLVYGQKMLDFFEKKGVAPQCAIHIGNLRYAYYKTRRASHSTSQFRQPSRSTLLYAPTWQDPEGSSSFFDATSLLIETLPDTFYLIIKPHPNLMRQAPEQVDALRANYEHKGNLQFLIDYPLIYPLLAQTDIYLGDASSIGYDFLAFDRPLFFLNQNQRDPETDEGAYLLRCGISVLPKQYPHIFAHIAEHMPAQTTTFSSIRKKVYDYTFGAEQTWDHLRALIQCKTA